MDATNEKPSATEEPQASNQDGPAGNNDATEFKIEIRKLEVPVKPRGVLAE